MLINKQLISVESNLKRLSKRFMCFGTPATCNASVSVHWNEIFKIICSKLHRFPFCTKFEIHANLKRFCTIPKSETAK